MSQLPADCLNEIFEYFGECNDKGTLHSCLLVNRLWCEVSVRILWRDDGEYGKYNRYCYTLIACLPNESKEILCKNGINIPTSTSPPMFNYAAFCKDISSYGLWFMIHILLNNQPSILSQKSDINSICIIAREMFKMFMDQISSLRKLDVDWTLGFQNITFVSYPGAEYCLKNLSELISCSNEPYSGFFIQLSQICHDIQTIGITLSDEISNGLIDLILSQKNIKYLSFKQHQESSGVITDIIPTLTNLPNTLIKLEICGLLFYHLPSIAEFTNLHELSLSTSFEDHWGGISRLKYLIFPHLQIFSFKSFKSYTSLHIFAECLDKFFKNNGKNLKELHVEGIDGLNLTIAESCPNLKVLTTSFLHNDLREIFNNCKHLESLTVICDETLNGNESLDIVAEYSPKNFQELILYNPLLLPEELESFFIRCTNRTSQKSFTLFVKSSYNNNLDRKEGFMKIIEKYRKLGVIRKFKFI